MIIMIEVHDNGKGYCDVRAVAALPPKTPLEEQIGTEVVDWIKAGLEHAYKNPGAEAINIPDRNQSKL